MHEPINILQKIGLNDKEAKVLLTLYEYGDQTAGLISKKSKVNRSTCYQILDNLKSKGLVSSYKKRDILFFHADDAQGLSQMLENKMDTVISQMKFLKDNIESLKALSASLGIKPKVKFYEGLEGVKKVYLDSLVENKDKEILAFFGKNFYTKELQNFITDVYLPRRLERNIKLKGIIESSIFASDDNSQLRERMPFQLDIEIELEMNIFNDKVAFISYSNQQYIAVVIEDAKIGQALRGMFKLMWGLLRNEERPN